MAPATSAAYAPPTWSTPATRWSCSTTCRPATATRCRPRRRFVEADLADGGGRRARRGLRRRAALRGQVAGRRVGAAARAVLAGQRRDRPPAARGDAPPRHAAAGVLLHGGHLRRARAGADPRRRADAPDEPVRREQARDRPRDHARTRAAHGLAAASLRYFNVAGAHGRFGERHAVETHLIPIVLQVASGHRECVQIFGDDWPTPDGTCVRDYIHVDDLADAHLLALAHAVPGEHAIYNLGSGTGFSVREVIEACRAVTGHPIPAVTSPPAGPATPPCSWPPARRRARPSAGARSRRTCDDRLRRVAVRAGASAGLTSGPARGRHARTRLRPHTRLTGVAVACRALPRASPAWPVAPGPTGTRGPVPAGCPPPTPRAGAG